MFSVKGLFGCLSAAKYYFIIRSFWPSERSSVSSSLTSLTEAVVVLNLLAICHSVSVFSADVYYHRRNLTAAARFFKGGISQNLKRSRSHDLCAHHYGRIEFDLLSVDLLGP